ncbi:MAG: response regulator transcription factor [Candidatus Hydrogenedentes bacterium]|nr:response regulator transcription factor [Candidatus Hydrogenedentota bacterium]
MQIRVFLADDHAVFRSGLRALLEKEENIVVVGEAGTGLDTFDQVKDGDVDVLLLDVNMPGMSGADVVRQLMPVKPRLGIVMLTMHDDSYYVQELFSLGIKGYVLKKSTGTDVLRAISAVFEGDSYLDPALVNMVMSPPLSKDKHQDGDRLSLLSQREKGVCRLLALGYSHAKIGQILNISPRTVDSHRANIMDKLELSERVDLVQFALDYGLLKPT